jgi:tetratricopeptide (TPR) repeat protein
LTELEDRGLLGWDRRANRYDMHPIVRGVTWSGLDDEERQETYEVLHDHFEALPPIDEDDVESLEDLTPAIELYNTLVGLGRYDDAFVVFRDRLSDVTLYHLSASRQRAELLEMLFPDGLDGLPRLSEAGHQGYTLGTLALAYLFSGQPGWAAPLFRQDIAICESEGDLGNVSINLGNLAYALFLSGELRESEAAARQALRIDREGENRSREALSLCWLGLALAARGINADSGKALNRSLQLASQSVEHEAYDYQAMRSLWFERYDDALNWADDALVYCRVQRYRQGMIRAARLQGAAAVGLDDLSTAQERLHHALNRARAVSLIQEELPALAALAELRRRQGDPKAARELLEDAWEPAERGPYSLLHADARNVLCQIERDAGNHDAAVEAATEAYRLAWCDGPPFAYHWGLEKARAHLAALGAPEPDDLPPYDEARYEPMPEVEIDPEDEFHAGE